MFYGWIPGQRIGVLAYIKRLIMQRATPPQANNINPNPCLCLAFIYQPPLILDVFFICHCLNLSLLDLTGLIIFLLIRKGEME